MREIEVSQLGTVCEQGGAAQLVDVRSAGEFAAGHVPGAVNIPLAEIERRLGDLNAKQTLVLICKGGTRAGIAAEFLKDKRGNLAVLKGGTEAWGRPGCRWWSARSRAGRSNGRCGWRRGCCC